MKCPVCGNKNYRLRFCIDKFNVIECGKCKLNRIEHNFSFDDIKSLYSSGYFNNKMCDVGYLNYEDAEKFMRINFKKRISRIIKNRKKDKFRLLDVGASTGYFLSECINVGIDSDGIEVSVEAIEFANRKFGITIEKTTVEEFVSEKQYDAITAWDVIEHSAYPDRFLKKINTLLKDNGKLYLTTGDVGSFVSRIFGKRWHLYNLPEHLFFYSKETIRRLLENSGFQVISIKYPWNYYSFGYLLERLLKKFLGVKDVKIIKIIAYNKLTKNIILPFNLFDIMEVEAIKK